MKFRKKPIVIDAEQFHLAHLFDDDCPIGVCDGINCDLDERESWEGQPHVHTLEGPLKVSDGDWIIRGIKGEYYPCKPDVFAATYEPVGTEAA